MKSIVKMRTWFGMEAVVEIGPGFIHKAGLGRVLIPHPPLINWLLRVDLPHEAKQTLSLLHEFGHLQATPLALLYAIVMMALSFVAGHRSWVEILLVLLSVLGAWEIMAEIFTISRTRERYTEFYKGVSVMPRLLFWIIVATLTISGWLIFFK